MRENTIHAAQTSKWEPITMRRDRRLTPGLLPSLAGVLLLFLAGPLAGQTRSEGYDPMRQITAQLVKANLLIVQDRTGSMQGDKFGYDIGDADGVTTDGPDVSPDNVTGRMFWERVLPNSTSTSSGGSTGAVPFAMVRTSNGASSATPNWGNIRGVGSPGIFYVRYDEATSTATILNTAIREFSFSFPWVSPTFPNYNNANNTVRAVTMPLLDSSNRLVYTCKPTGTWSTSTGTPGTRLPWNTGSTPAAAEYFQYNNQFDLTQCAMSIWQLRFDLPSRIANVKNALGNSVYLQEGYTPPPVTSAGKPVSRWPAPTSWLYSTTNFPSGNPWAWFNDATSTSLLGKRAYYQEGVNRPLNPNIFDFMIGYLFGLENNALRYDPTPASAARNRVVATPTWVKDPGRPFKAFYANGDVDLPVPNDENGDPVLPAIPTRPLPASPPAGRLAKVWGIGMPRPGFGTVGPFRKPQDVVGVNAERINFGLLAYSSDGYYLHVPIDTTDGNNVARFQAVMSLYRTSAETSNVSYTVPRRAVPVDPGSTESVSGLTAGGGTPTRTALQKAQGILPLVFDGGSVGDLSLYVPPSGSSPDSFTWSQADPKKLCNRPYGVVLVTDGHSNNSNPNSKNWIKPCSSDPAQPNYGDTCTGSDDCPMNWASYAAQPANDIWVNGLTPGGGLPVIRPRTWAIGISPTVGPCELSFIAYMGRTDASSPAGDAGFSGYDATKNPYLPDPAKPVDANPVGSSAAGTYDGPTGQRMWAKNTSKVYRAPSDVPAPWWGTDPAAYPEVTGHGYNAFFATDAKALGEAFTTIVNATATGDYATNAPVSGMSAGAAEMVYLPSTGFPSWEGHLYAFNTKKKPTEDGYLFPDWNGGTCPTCKGDAGAVLNATDASTRKIFTWDPSNGNALVELTAANLATIKAIAGTTAFTSAVLDFVRGNDGAGNPRTWRLGPMINSAPAIVGPPGSWLQSTTVDHKSFQSANSGRDALLWVGSNHGMMHAFRIKDGVEQIALLPPGLLARQIDLYENFTNDKRSPKNPSGQPVGTADHIYGVANSFRFGDVYNGTEFRTVGILTLGPGGTGIAAVDVTKVPRPDAKDYPSDPVSILWTKVPGTSTGSGQLPELKETWSIPAMAAASSSKWRLFAGSGFNPGNTRTAQTTSTGFIAPRAYVLDPASGAHLQTFSLTSKSSPSPYVGNQAFADAVFFDPRAKVYQDDNIAKMGLQADLNGQIWFIYDSAGNLSYSSAKVGIDVSTTQSQPIYYNPAASGYGATDAGCVAYAFGSGTLYERSDLVTGSLVGTAGNFIPRLYVATAKKDEMTNKLAAGNITGRAIGGDWNLSDGDRVTVKTLGPRTQLTAPPFMLVPKSGTGSITALFLLYDPDDGCNGSSYVVKVDFEGSSSCTPQNATYTAYSAGVGAASGFTIAGDKVLVSKSGIGQGQRASLYEPPDIAASIGSSMTPRVRWWRELK